MSQLFVLQRKTQLPDDPAPSVRERYDPTLQLWLDAESGEPIVTRERHSKTQSSFGETTLTETKEGADQSEIATLHASRFGETTLTKTQEGTDQSEGSASWTSRFGEAVNSESGDGDHQSEIQSAHWDGCAAFD